MLKKIFAIFANYVFYVLFFLNFLFLNFANQIFAAEFLPPEKAFVGSIENITFDKKNNTAELNIFYEIANNYYLYKDKIKVVIDNDTKSVVINNILLPVGVLKNDENFGKVEVFFNQLKVVVNLQLSDNVDENFLTNFFKKNGVNISVQGCAENGICYPPLLQTLNFSGEISKKNLTNLVENSQNETSQIAQMLNNKNFFAILLFFLVAGLGLAFTPCVLPMIPILSAMLAKQNAQNSQNNSVLLSILYVLGMALTYSIIGIIAGLTGTLLNQLIQNTYILISISFIFILLALSMFGFYELQLPNYWQNKINEKNNQISKGKIGIFMMGVLSALLVSPCVVAPLAGALLYIGKTGDAIFGGIALFCLAIGMGIPLIVVGFAGKKLLPKTGSWMLLVKKFFGVIMLATALWMLRPLLSPFWWIFLWALLLIFCGIFLKAIDSLSADATSIQRFFKAVGFVILLCGILLFVGAISGANDIFNPLSKFKYSEKNSKKISENSLNFVEIHNENDLKNAMNSSKNVLIEFSAEWCISCKEIERDVFANPLIIAEIQAKSLQLFKIDVSENTAIQRKFLQKFNLFGPPGILFFQNGEELENLRIVGYKNADEFLDILAKIK